MNSFKNNGLSFSIEADGRGTEIYKNVVSRNNSVISAGR